MYAQSDYNMSNDSRMLAAETFKRLFDSQRKTLEDIAVHDAHFLVGPQQVQMSGLRGQLASRSAYFRSMFFGSAKMQESQAGAVVKLENMDPDAFRNILQYCYTESADLNENNVIATLDAAKYCHLDFLAEACRSWLKENLTQDTCCMIRQQAEQYNEQELAHSADILIREHSASLLQQDSFSVLPKDYVKSLIARDDLDVDKEVLYY